MSVFDVDTKGLSQLIEDQGPGRLIVELVRNSLDEDGVTRVAIDLAIQPGRPLCWVNVTDDAPLGFADLSHAYTLFAPSYKKQHAEKAGRFNMGDKLFLAAAIETGKPAVIKSTSGCVKFEGGKRTRPREKTEKGSEVEAHLKMTRDQYHGEVMPLLKRLILPPGVEVKLNGDVLETRTALHEFLARLPTDLADEEGVLRRVTRETVVRVYEPPAGNVGSLFELGVPVVETGDRFDIDVQMKIPLNMQRDNVPPSYLRTLRTLVVNEMASRLTEEDANQTWVREAAGDDRIDTEVMTRILDLRFGEKRAVYDPSDPEANKNAVASGFTVIQGGMLNRDEWDNLRRTGTTLPAGKLFPTRHAYEGGPGSPTVEFVPEDKWTPGMKHTAEYTRFLGRKLLDREVTVRFVDPSCRLNHFAACWSGTEIHFNVWKLGLKWFGRVAADVDELLSHEMGHYFSGDHLSEEYHEALCRLAARMKRAALDDPEGFRAFERGIT